MIIGVARNHVASLHVFVLAYWDGIHRQRLRIEHGTYLVHSYSYRQSVAHYPCRNSLVRVQGEDGNHCVGIMREVTLQMLWYFLYSQTYHLQLSLQFQMKLELKQPETLSCGLFEWSVK